MVRQLLSVACDSGGAWQSLFTPRLTRGPVPSLGRLKWATTEKLKFNQLAQVRHGLILPG